MVEAGLCAPNHKLSDPVRYVALRGDARERLGAIWGAAAADARGDEGERREKTIEKESRKTKRAPLLLVVSVRTVDDVVRAEEDYATASAATQNVLLAAHALGYGAIWRTGDMVRSAPVRAHLGLNESDRIVGIVYVGEIEGDVPDAPERDVNAHLTVLT